jgi:type VI secretion system secreted protein Hcp
MADCFIKLKDVVGESGDAEFKDAIAVESWGWGITQHASAGWDRKSTGRAQAADLVFTHQVDFASPGLLQRCARNQVIDTAELTMRRAGGKAQKYLFIKMKQVRVLSCTLIHDAMHVVPQERVALAYREIEIEYAPQSDAGQDRSGKASFSHRTDATE